MCGMCGDTFAESESLRKHHDLKHSHVSLSSDGSQMTNKGESSHGMQTSSHLGVKDVSMAATEGTSGLIVKHSIKQDKDGEDNRMSDTNIISKDYVSVSSSKDSSSKFEPSASSSERVLFHGSSYVVDQEDEYPKVQTIGGNIRIELNSEYGEADDDLQAKLKKRSRAPGGGG